MRLIVRNGLPRLPLDGKLDLTYRCNNTCRHCWLWLPANSPQGKEELSYEEIRGLIDEARAMGCQAWAISGGEPMLRPDFTEILDYITYKAVHYSLNTNGTLITPEIAQFLKRKGKKMVALYGATAEVHDLVTRNPGSFEATMRGFAYLREAGAGFVVQIIPLRANYHQYSRMLELAQSLSPQYRIGAPWLWLSASRSDARNREINQQRLDPETVIVLDEPLPLEEAQASVGNPKDSSGAPPSGINLRDDRLFAACIKSRRDFHIDPYGQLSFCYYIKDPALRYDLRQGTFRQAWDEFIPSLANAVHGGKEYQENCGTCEQRLDCRWCGVYGYLEHGRYSAKVEYLCKVAEKARQFKEDWRMNHIHYFQIAGLTIQLIADFLFSETDIASNIQKFQVDGLGDDRVTIRLVSSVPPMSEIKLGELVYAKPPWAIYKQSRAWVYVGGTSEKEYRDPSLLAIFDENHDVGTIYRKGNFFTDKILHSLTTFPTDQILLSRVLANRQGCYLHSSAFVLDGKGLLFVGHSEAGKSTMMKLLRGQGEILCDDRNIVRRWPEGFRVHGTWSHGELPDVSPASAPLHAIFLLEKADCNELIPIEDIRERLGLVLSHVVKPLVTADWWKKTLDLAGKIAAEVPIYRLRFDKSGEVVELIKQLCKEA